MRRRAFLSLAAAALAVPAAAGGRGPRLGSVHSLDVRSVAVTLPAPRAEGERVAFEVYRDCVPATVTSLAEKAGGELLVGYAGGSGSERFVGVVIASRDSAAHLSLGDRFYVPRARLLR